MNLHKREETFSSNQKENLHICISLLYLSHFLEPFCKTTFNIPKLAGNIAPQKAAQQLRGENDVGPKQKTRLSHLLEKLKRCYNFNETPNRDDEAFKEISSVLKRSQIDNMKPLTGLQQHTPPNGVTDENLGDRVLSEPRGLVSDYSGLQQQILPYATADDSSVDRGYGTSDENALRKQILDTHESDNSLFAAKAVIYLVEVIFQLPSSDLSGSTAAPKTGFALVDAADEKALHSRLPQELELPNRVISEINRELFCKLLNDGDSPKKLLNDGDSPKKLLNDGDVHSTTLEILRLVKHYTWDAKAVLAVGALAVSYGEFRLAATLYMTIPMAKAVALLKQLPKILELEGSLKAMFDGVYTLVRASVAVIKIIDEFNELHRDRDPYSSDESLEAHNSFSILIPTAVYWVVRSTVICASQIWGLTDRGHEYVSEASELSPLAHKLSTIYSDLLELFRRCQNLVIKISIILEQSHLDNSETLRNLFLAKDDLPLYDCHEKRKISIDELRGKVVVLFITSLDILQEDHMVIYQIYQEKRAYPLINESQYEIVWIPIEDSWTYEKYQMFESIKQQLDWHTVHHPTVVPWAVVKYFRQPEKCRFEKKPIFVVLDTQGKIVHKNAYHIMCIWGSVAYPFSETKERLLWKEETWRMDLLVDSIDTRLTSWIQTGKYVCLFGGEDIDWIRRFTRTIKEAARDSGILLELLYMGKSKPKEETINKINAIIEAENLGSTIDYNYIWYFWLRIESMWYSKGQFLAERRESVKHDPIAPGIISLLNFGSGTNGWAVISRGSLEITKGNGVAMLNGLNGHVRWMRREKEIGFLPALYEYLQKLHAGVPRNHYYTSPILPATEPMRKTMSCPKCGSLMERFTMYS